MINGEGVAAIIIGRAGSKGLPGKNTRTIAGQAMVAYSIDAARASKYVDTIIVSTDSAELATHAREAGVHVVDRPAHLASDTATVDAAARHAVAAAADDASIIIILYANVPVRPAGIVDRAIEQLASQDADSVQSYANVGKYHPWWMSRIDDAGRVQPYDDHGVYRRQDLPPLFIPDGGVIAVRRDALFSSACDDHPHAFLGSRCFAIINQPGEVVDIDTEADLHVAEAMLHSASMEARSP